MKLKPNNHNFLLKHILLFFLSIIIISSSYSISNIENNLTKNDSTKIKNRKEISHAVGLFTYTRLDWYPEFTYNINGRPSIDYVKIKGIGWGMDVNYKLSIYKQIYFITGIGYYRYSFNKIKKVNTLFGESNARHIDYPSPIEIIYYTNKYWYNSINLNIGIGKQFNLKRNMQLTTAISVNNYFTLSQYYHLTYNPEGSQKYKTKDKQYFGTSLLLSFGVSKQIKSSQIGGLIQLSTFDIWKTDAVFRTETDNSTRKKWFRGFTIGIEYNYSITKHKK